MSGSMLPSRKGWFKERLDMSKFLPYTDNLSSGTLVGHWRSPSSGIP